MTAKQFQATLKRLGFRSLYQAGPYLGVSQPHMSRLASGQAKVQPTLRLLLEAYLRHGVPWSDRGCNNS